MTEPIKQYVAGFLFNRAADGDPVYRPNDPALRVALIEKLKPEWQLGLCNGIGGKIEPDETPADAMVREFHEETGFRFDGWQFMFKLVHSTNGWVVHFYRGFTPTLNMLRSMTDEQVTIASTTRMPKCIPNLYWMVPLAADHDIIFPLADITDNGGITRSDQE